MPNIRVHEKALAHLSRGLYRSPASALRELVSNGWDANATSVRITTNYPNFYQLAVQDNGDGFSREEFASLMGGGIGNSEKRPSGKILINNRPLIGRLGIGMLGIAQVCGSFVVTSKMKNGKGFRAKVSLYDLLKERLDTDDPTIIRTEEVDVGTYDFIDYEPGNTPRGTSIITDDVHPTFVRAFQQSVKYPEFEPPPSTWKAAMEIIERVRSLQELGDYWRLLWELSASCPVPYLSGNSVPKNLVADYQKKLVSYDFKVIVDSLELKKPVALSGNAAGYTTKKIGPLQKQVYGKPLSFGGYICVQEGSQLKPDELRGLLVRIKNVAIGYYDPSLLDYRFNEGPRSRWLTGEIYVDEGMEDALNIDRDSFNRFHPQFRAMQEFVHCILQSEIFPEVYKQIEVRSRNRAKGRRVARSGELKRTIEGVTQKRVAITAAPESISAETEPRVKQTATRIQIAIPDEASLRIKKSQRQLAASILSIFEVALAEPTMDQRRNSFRRLLLSLLARW